MWSSVFTMNLFVTTSIVRPNRNTAITCADAQLCKTHKILHVLIVTIYELPSSVHVWFIPHCMELCPLIAQGHWGSKTLSRSLSLSLANIHTHTPSPTLPARLYINWSTLLSRQTDSLSHCLGPVTPWLLLASTLSIIFSAGNHFHWSILLVSVQQHLVWPKAKST